VYVCVCDECIYECVYLFTFNVKGVSGRGSNVRRSSVSEDDNGDVEEEIL
jgi:hypothetical protein